MTDKHREGIKQLTLWVDEALLKKWDAFKRSYSVNRSAMIVTAVNEYMENHRDVQPNTKASMMIEQKLTEIKDVLDKKDDITAEQAAVVINNPKNKSRVIRALKGQPRDSEDSDLEMDEPNEIPNVFYDQPTEKRKNDR